MQDDFTADVVSAEDDTDQDILLWAREVEWAEAYAADHPTCETGAMYLEIARRELTQALAWL